MKVKVIKQFFRNILFHKSGRCNICGHRTLFICTNRITTDRNMVCIFCKSKSRQRMVAKTLLELLEHPRSSLKKFAAISDRNIYNLDTGDVFSEYLHSNRQYYSSGYFPEKGFGMELSERVFSQNVEALTFKNDFFDYIISEHVFEHVRDEEAGFREVYRVLKKGGVHLFSIPYHFDQTTVHRVDTAKEKDMFISPPEYHGDPHSKDRRILVYRKYGYDLFEMLRDIGFDTRIVQSDYMDYKRYGIVGSFVFLSTKQK